jgi:hypothetical protein
MNKRTIMFGAMAGLTIGSVVPMLWGDYNSFGVTSVLLGLVGGLLGIWITAWLSKQLG